MMAEKITITSYDQQGNIPKDFTGEVTFAIPGQTAKTRSYIEGSMKSGKFGQEEWAEGFKVAEYDPTNRQYVATETGRRYATALARPENRNIFARDPQGAKQAIELLKMQGQSIPDWLIAAAQGAGSADGSAGDGTGTSAAALAAQQAAQAAAEEKRRQGQSAYNLLFEQFNQYGLGALVAPLQALIVDGLSPAEFTLRLRDTDAYKKRFAANQARIQRGLRALSEAEYIGLEDQYQNVMRNYGLPANYYTRGDMGRQEGFERFISGDVSAAELEDRIQTAQNRVINAAPEVSRALREFYPGITNGDILAYALDPDKALTDIRRKVTAAEIGAGAMQAGLATGVARAEELGRFGVTGEQARQGFATIAEFLPTAQKLGDIYRKQGLGDFTQATAEQEVFGITGAAEAATKRKRLTQLEQAAFSGQTGMSGGALARDRAGAI